MLSTYFKIVRKALAEKREKGKNKYYEAHHIVPQCFEKRSSIVLLTPEEHYRVHKILAEEFKLHPTYGTKLMWAYHRLSYDGKRQLTEKEYGEARRILMGLWARPKSKSHKENIGRAHKNKKWMYNETIKKHVQINESEVQLYVKLGWVNSHKFKENWIPTEDTRKNMSISATKAKLGKIGEESRASKGAAICENKETGEKIEAGSALQLAKKIGVHYSVIHEELNRNSYRNETKPRGKNSKYYDFLQKHKIYYRDK
ncbi:MAG: hypothetical protein EBZ49_01190 [Proteobacteria bacterium]|nr:hypothetical protein [Pseudomonadota bacterium]